MKMKVALLGYGKMGKTIERILKEQGDEVVAIVDELSGVEVADEKLKQADVAIEFSAPDVAVGHYFRCFRLGLPVVSGTTGWLERWEEVVGECEARKAGFFYASNFSVGVNIFFQVNRYLAQLMSRFKEYEVLIEETHHIHKLDAPSGTAITLAEGVIENHENYNSWQLNAGGDKEDVVPIVAKREGEIPGIHSVTYKSKDDEIKIFHSAQNREGFAKGAILAAGFMKGKRGVFGMENLLK